MTKCQSGNEKATALFPAPITSTTTNFLVIPRRHSPRVVRSLGSACLPAKLTCLAYAKCQLSWPPSPDHFPATPPTKPLRLAVVFVNYNKGKDTTPSANKVMLQLANIPKNKTNTQWAGDSYPPQKKGRV